MRKTLIQHREVGAGGAASIEFTNIPQTYTDLYLVVSLRTTFATDQDHVDLLFNGSSANQTHRLMRGDGSSAASFTLSRMYTNSNSSTSNTFGNMAFYIPNYTSSNAKIISTDSVTEGNATSENQAIQATLWNDTSSISSIEIVSANSANFVQYSSASLYGVSKYNVAGGSPKATGGIISYDSTNDKWVHVFAASGTFTPSENLTAEYLVVAGGGGGGGGSGFLGGGGGGAGGYRSSVSGESSGGGASAETPLSLTASTGYTVTVGAGGAAGLSQTNGSTNGGEGNNSVFSTITSDGGGGGGAGGQISGQLATDGGSGGGQGSRKAGSGSGTANQGFDGGEAELAGDAGGGGGGAGSAGETVTGIAGGDGGSGVSSSITGSSVARAGGGGGGGDTSGEGVGTAGGGDGADGYSATPTAGIANFGGGGGGGSSNTINGAAGSSGIVIVRYSA